MKIRIVVVSCIIIIAGLINYLAVSLKPNSSSLITSEISNLSADAALIDELEDAFKSGHGGRICYAKCYLSTCLQFIIHR
ncbi:hypothetical protein PanWU01x14_286810 [Parasponia andersonii]|uniref:Transmembrane protein n=1 Tax=Parasponia andersonii TaxID=3476 RepID=A0A2P5AZ71_PARAD|nr:hypothetical protein PanWU01x14_286810 [Parasponia andersonii]